MQWCESGATQQWLAVFVAFGLVCVAAANYEFDEFGSHPLVKLPWVKEEPSDNWIIEAGDSCHSENLETLTFYGLTYKEKLRNGGSKNKKTFFFEKLKKAKSTNTLRQVQRSNLTITKFEIRIWKQFSWNLSMCSNSTNYFTEATTRLIIESNLLICVFIFDYHNNRQFQEKLRLKLNKCEELFYLQDFQRDHGQCSASSRNCIWAHDAVVWCDAAVAGRLRRVWARLCSRCELRNSMNSAVYKGIREKKLEFFDPKNACNIRIRSGAGRSEDGHETVREHGLFEKSTTDLKKCLTEDQDLADKKTTDLKLLPDLSLHDLILMGPDQAAKRLSLEDYHRFAWANQLHGQVPEKVLHSLQQARVREKLARGFFRRWALYPFWDLIHYLVPIECCEAIIARPAWSNRGLVEHLRGGRA
ncbi:unnamed protein product [Trichogramma brassicae]|uniref:Uncharacterized protein n=1 Tax=Trichogramma brassicae TaxID=86971 RepID=A0A6H5IHJ1_9HYME|nr:unnamed protein product [Trichogramma brassicae]